MNNLNTVPKGKDSATDFAERVEASMGGRVTLSSRACGFGMIYSVLEGEKVREESDCRFDAETAGLAILSGRMQKAANSTEKILIENQVMVFLKSCRPSYVSDLLKASTVD